MSERWEDMTELKQELLLDEIRESIWVKNNADWSYQNFYENPKEHKELWPELYSKHQNQLQ